jgi:two-component system nitrate/nitrite response regulator NarL
MRVLLIAEQRLLTDVLSERLADEPGFVVSTEDETDRARVENAINRLRPALVVTSNLAVGSMVLDAQAGVALAVLAPIEDSAHAVAAARAGAIAWLPMSSSVEELVTVLRGAAEGRAHFPAEHLTVVLRELRRDVSRALGTRGPLDLLSDREHDVLGGLVDGRSNKEIAQVLSVSGNTVRTHVRNIFRKLGVHSRLEAVRAARIASEAGQPGELRVLPTERADRVIAP